MQFNVTCDDVTLHYRQITIHLFYPKAQIIFETKNWGVSFRKPICARTNNMGALQAPLCCIKRCLTFATPSRSGLCNKASPNKLVWSTMSRKRRIMRGTETERTNKQRNIHILNTSTWYFATSLRSSQSPSRTSMVARENVAPGIITIDL